MFKCWPNIVCNTVFLRVPGQLKRLSANNSLLTGLMSVLCSPATSGSVEDSTQRLTHPSPPPLTKGCCGGVGGGLTQRDNAHCQRHQSRGSDVTLASSSRDNVSSHLYVYKVASSTLSNEDTLTNLTFIFYQARSSLKRNKSKL